MSGVLTGSSDKPITTTTQFLARNPCFRLVIIHVRVEHRLDAELAVHAGPYIKIHQSHIVNASATAI